MNETYLLAAFIIAVLAMGVASIIYDRRQKNVPKDTAEHNIQFGAVEGTGIELVKKEYPDVELKDDFRETVKEVKEIKYFHERKRNE